MGVKIRKIRILTTVLMSLELVGVAIFLALYLLDFFSLKTALSFEYILFIMCAILAFNCCYIVFFSIYVAKLGHKTDLHAAEILGSDIQEAYNFASIGLAVTDENYVVMWTNDLFKKRNLDIVDENIIEWNHNLEPLTGPNSADLIANIEVYDKCYAVKFLQDAGLWIFKDTSKLVTLERNSKAQAPVVGILSIDNYTEVFKADEDYNELATNVKNVIFSYAKEYKLLLRRFKDESYTLLCTYDSYLMMKKDNFSILDKVREASKEEEIPLTLSIGLATSYSDITKLNELAKNALDIAMSRGGDQVVVSVYGGEMEFYGGKTNATEKRNRVKVRVLADSLISVLKESDNVLVMGHKYLDMDALGACFGIVSMCRNERIAKPAQIIIDQKLMESKARSALNSLFSKDELSTLTISPHDALEAIVPKTLLVLVDVHTKELSLFPDIISQVGNVAVIDHHRRGEDYINSPTFNHIDPAASSTCEIITEFVKFSSNNPRIIIPSVMATIMLSGIFLDSSYYKSKSTGIRTFEASTILKEFGADNSLADDLLKDDYEEYVEVNNIVQQLKTPFYGIVYASGLPDKFYDNSTIAKASNVCLTMKGIHASFVFAKINNKEIRMSCRSDGTINVQIIAEKLGGGGHFSAAAVAFKDKDLSEVESILLETLDRVLAEARNNDKNKKVGD